VIKQLEIQRALAGMLALWLSHANAQTPWPQLESQARGQTVYFNAWGGSELSNAYIAWAAAIVQQRYGVVVRHVKITDPAEMVKRIQTEVAAGRQDDGSIDLLWLNGEIFKQLKQAHLLFGPWAEQLPNWQYIDLTKPVRQDFSIATEGFEAPWGFAQLTFMANRAVTPIPPRSAAELLQFAALNSGRVSYPKPPEFHGLTFIKQLLLELAPHPVVLQRPVTDATFQAATQPLWAYLDRLHPLLWRKGKAFPVSAAEMHRMLGDGELKLSFSFNPNEGAYLMSSKQLPRTAYSFGFNQGTIGNVHFVAIPVNAPAKAGAQVFANFLMSPEAQARKADLAVWGDSSVLDQHLLAAALRALMNKKAAGALAEPVILRAEPHASWVHALEVEWLRRYGTR
jgi:putative thiamine transport system substrate-binding protein